MYHKRKNRVSLLLLCYSFLVVIPQMRVIYATKRGIFNKNFYTNNANNRRKKTCFNGRLYSCQAEISHTELHIFARQTEYIIRQLAKTFPKLKTIRIKFKLCVNSCALANKPGSLYAGGYYWAAKKTVFIQHFYKLKKQKKLRSTLKHELIHAALHKMGPNNLPLWLEEGIAFHFSKELLQKPATRSRIASFKQLNWLLYKLSHQKTFSAWQKISVCYWYTRQAVRVLIQINGTQHLIRFVRAIKQGVPPTQALRSYYMLSWKQLAERCL